MIGLALKVFYCIKTEFGLEIPPYRKGLLKHFIIHHQKVTMAQEKLFTT